MKRFAVLLSLILLVSPLYAQHKGCKSPRMEEMISTLTPKQKRQLEAIDNEQRAQIDAVKKELRQVRDSVQMYISLYGDNTKTVNRLLEREAALQLRMNKMLYATKVKIDQVITLEQHREMREAMAKRKERLKEPGRPTTGGAKKGPEKK